MSSTTTASTIDVTRTYLELRDPAELRAALSDDPAISIRELPDCSVEMFRFLYAEVGRNYHWIDRLPWTDEQIVEHLQKSENSIWLMTYNSEPAGYFELRNCDDGSIEIAYFGLIPQFIGRGLGKHLLICAVNQAWHNGAQRVWLHTCTLDDPAAMPNYLNRGFKPFKTENYEVTMAGAGAGQ
jgi:GNAT superfamily N-acetyltransferase